MKRAQKPARHGVVVLSEWTARELARLVRGGHITQAVAEAEIRSRPTRDPDWRPGERVLELTLPERRIGHVELPIITPRAADHRFARGEVVVEQRAPRGVPKENPMQDRDTVTR